MQSARPAVICIAGSDSAGLAGLQMDCRVHHAMGVHSHHVVTAVTAQNNDKVLAVNPVLGAALSSQIEALQVFSPAAIKTGLIADRSQLPAIVNLARTSELPLVCDPVMVSTAGDALAEEDFGADLLHELLPYCTLVTPNIDEAQKLTKHKIQCPQDMEIAAQKLVEAGAGNVYLKGGHIETAQGMAQDYFYSKDHSFWLSAPRLDTPNTRGTGCALASAASAALALGYSVADAVVIARMTIHQGLRQAYPLSSGHKGAIDVREFPCLQQDLPYLTNSADFELTQPAFASCGEDALGLYPVVDSADWLRRLLPTGISTAQLRVKDLQGKALEREICEAIELGRHHNCRLFINDYWKLAIKHNAYGVHLGQEDLDDADITAIRQAGLRLGTSTHCHYEVARAHTLKPSYIACGPVYPTATKIMPWIPHGLKGLAYWQNVLDYPLVAIGGINENRVPAVAATGVSGIAMITAITEAKDPAAASRGMMESLEANRL